MENVMGCDVACHSPSGKPFQGTFENVSFGPISGVFAVPNLTSDVETGIGGWTDAEIARAIREGLDKDGVELVIMPSADYHRLSDEDVAAIVGYLRQLPPTKNPIPPFQLNSIGKVMIALKVFSPRSPGKPISDVQEAPPRNTPEYGGYLVSLGACRECHGHDLSGGPTPFAEPGSPEAANLTPAGNLSHWRKTDFIQATRNGITPEGKSLTPEAIPWPTYGGMTDDDLGMIFDYLASLPAAGD